MKRALIKYTFLLTVLLSITNVHPLSSHGETKVLPEQSMRTDEQQHTESCLAIKSGATLEKTVSTYINSENTVIWDNPAFWNDVAGIGRDDACDLHQKQSISANDDAIITIGLGKIFPSNDENTNSFAANNSVLMWGNNGKDLSWIKINERNKVYILERLWLVKETNTVGKVEVSVNSINFPDVPFNSEIFNVEIYLLTNKAVDFKKHPPHGHKMTKKGNNYSVQYDFTDHEYFTIEYVIARKIRSVEK